MIASGHVLGAHGAYAVGLEWCPGSAALLTCAILRIDVATLGWHWRPWRWQILAYVTPLAVCAVAYGVVWTTGLGGFPNMKTVAELRDSLGLGGLTTPEVILLWVALWLTGGSVRSLASASGPPFLGAPAITGRIQLSPRAAESLLVREPSTSASAASQSSISLPMANPRRSARR